MAGKMTGGWCLLGGKKNVRCILWTVTIFSLTLASAGAAEKDTPAAAATRKKLQAKISVDYKDLSIKEVMEDIKQKVSDATGMDLSIYVDNQGGVSNNSTLSYSAKDQTVAEILDGMFKNNDLGYVVVSKEYKTYKGRYDGWLLIVKGKERGYPEEPGKEPAAKDKDNEKKSAEKPKDKPATDKPAAEKPADKPEDDTAKAERDAGRQLKYVKGFIEDGKSDLAIKHCKEIIKKYPKTSAAQEAKKLLEKLEK
jgi:hypothetical protein